MKGFQMGKTLPLSGISKVYPVGKKRILVVDDEPYVLRVIQMKLENAGYQVETVGDGISAWEKIQIDKPDMLITDIVMPGLNGYELIRKVRSEPETRELPVLMLTGRGQDVDELKGYEAGVDKFLTKPFSPKELLSIVGEILGGQNTIGVKNKNNGE